MKRLLSILALASLVAACGPSAQVSRDDTEVNIGYGTVKKSDLTNSVTNVKVDEREIKTYSTIYEYLQGRVAGVVVLPDHRIMIRGVNSINSSTEPLFILDGVETRNISSINPNDIKSVDVIKDGSAAIYGMRGANGVIVITTKNN